MDMKRLVKSNQNRIICGVCGGIGQYFGLDATLIRHGLYLALQAAAEYLLIF